MDKDLNTMPIGGKSQTGRPMLIRRYGVAKLLLKSRYLILLPILGLALAAAVFFVLGGIGLIRLLYESVPAVLNTPLELTQWTRAVHL